MTTESAEPMEITSQMSEIDMSKQPVMEVDITVEHPGTQEIIQEISASGSGSSGNQRYHF